MILKVIIIAILIPKEIRFGDSELIKVSSILKHNMVHRIMAYILEAKDACGEKSLKTDFNFKNIEDLLDLEEEQKNHYSYGICKH